MNSENHLGRGFADRSLPQQHPAMHNLRCLQAHQFFRKPLNHFAQQFQCLLDRSHLSKLMKQSADICPPYLEFC